MQFKRRRAPGRRGEEVHVPVRQNRQKGCKGCDRTKNAWLAIEIALGYEEGKGNGFNYKNTHTRSSRQRYMQMFSCP